MGLVVMSADLDEIFDALAANKVPTIYLKAYPSLKPLGSWTRDLMARLEQITTWIKETYPKVYWLAGFTYPSCFLTAVLQTTARKNAIPIDTLLFEYSVVNVVGLYMLNSVDPYSLKAPGDPTLEPMKTKKLVSSLCFSQMQLVPLHRGG
jgi:hypothetical protein